MINNIICYSQSLKLKYKTVLKTCAYNTVPIACFKTDIREMRGSYISLNTRYRYCAVSTCLKQYFT